MPLVGDIFTSDENSFVDKIGIKIKKALHYLVDLRYTIYMLITYNILRKEPKELSLVRRVIYYFIFVNAIDFVVKKVTKNKKKSTHKLISIGLHLSAILLSLILLKKLKISFSNIDSIKAYIKHTIANEKSEAEIAKKLLPLLLIPILIINSIINAAKEYKEFDEPKIIKKYYNTFTGKFETENYFKDIPIYKRLLSNFGLIYNSISEKNFSITGLLILNNILNSIDTNIATKRNDLLFGSVYKIIVDSYVILNPLLKIISNLQDKKLINQ